jgi:hypothetical protein
MKQMQRKVFMKKSVFILGVVIAAFFLQVNFNFVKAAGPTTTTGSGLVACGKDADHMCTLCDIIVTINTIIQYLMKISIGVALAVFTAAGIMYISSAGGSKMIEMAKSAMKNATIGFIVVLAAYLIIDAVVLKSIGAQKDLNIGVTSWGTFDCNATKGNGG